MKKQRSLQGSLQIIITLTPILTLTPTLILTLAHSNYLNSKSYPVFIAEWRPPGDYACPGEPEHIFRTRMKDLYQWLAGRPEKG
jgi:hypothetical protein